ncbi:MAG: type II toxin-antitoxin system HicA family toxin [Oscillospiraceae bacterium]|nr:type II toxin-antitoxin system HicA family toxin [Oscillospiraceae bacterium]
MNRQKLVKKLTKNGWWFVRHGSKHDIYTDGIATESIPRHKDINEDLARDILSRNGIK